MNLLQRPTIGILLCLTLLILLSSPCLTGDGEARTLKGNKCFVESTYGDKAFLKMSVKLMSSSVQLSELLLGKPVPADDPIGLEVFGDLASYQKRDQELTGGMFQTNLAFTDYKTNNSYICMQPRYSKDYAVAETMNELMETLIVHEAFHACSYRQIENAKEWPSWLAEGLGEYVTVLYLNSRKSLPAIKTLWYQRKLHYVRKQLQAGTLPSVATLLLSDTFQSLGVGTDAGYGMAMLLMQFVAEDSKYKSGFKKFITSLPQANMEGDGNPFQTKFRATITDNLDQLNVRFVKWVEGLKYSWIVDLRHAWSDGKVLHLCSFDKRNARILHTGLLPEDKYSIEVDLRIRKCGLGQADLVFGYTDNRLFKIAAGAAGWVTLLKLTDEKWENLLNKNLVQNAFQNEAWANLRLVRKGKALIVFLNGDSVLTYNVTNEAQVCGRWGLGATNSMVEFKNIKLNGKSVPLK